MDKKEILARSRAENAAGDEREQSLVQKFSLFMAVLLSDLFYFRNNETGFEWRILLGSHLLLVSGS